MGLVYSQLNFLTFYVSLCKLCINYVDTVFKFVSTIFLSWYKKLLVILWKGSGNPALDSYHISSSNIHLILLLSTHFLTSPFYGLRPLVIFNLSKVTLNEFIGGSLWQHVIDRFQFFFYYSSVKYEITSISY